MANPFGMFKEYVDKPKRNIFDLSFQNNLTLDYGYIYPVFCKEVVPGDSMRISPRMAFNFMPTAFPIQTRQRAYMQFFYVRNRTLWKDWMDFVGKTKDGLVSPYIDFAGQVPKTGSLYDYFGLPTTIAGNYGSQLVASNYVSHDYSRKTHTFTTYTSDNGITFLPREWYLVKDIPTTEYYMHLDTLADVFNNLLTSADEVAEVVDTALNMDGLIQGLQSLPGDYCSIFNFWEFTFTEELKTKISTLSDTDTVSISLYSPGRITLDIVDQFIALYNKSSDSILSNDTYLTHTSTTYRDGYYTTDIFVSALRPFLESDNLELVVILGFGLVRDNFSDSPVDADNVKFFKENYTVKSAVEGHGGTLTLNGNNWMQLRGFNVTSSDSFEVSDITSKTSPYYDSTSVYKDSQLKINALPYRAYEAICNCYFRDDRNNPFILNGVPEYNRYITNNEGGSDNTRYTLYRRNWEQDFLTTAVQSPQQGIAPLVGITSTGEMTFADDDGKLYRAKANVSTDGNTIESFSVLSSDMPSGNLRALVDMASSGIGINDLRNVNALQRWLETNIRRGYKYRDQIMSHYGVDVRYDELDMPEFIGGMSEDVSVRQVNNTSVADGSTLGDYAGQMFIGASGGRSITHYCDEHGFIIGVLSIVPVPVYSQLLSKQFLKLDVLDYYFPEFGHIGMQPITYDQVSPVQTYNASPGDLNKEFGYQRSWYEYLSSVDECHGLFRTELQNFLLNRVFNTKPELSEEFLKVDPDQLNRVFTVTKYGNKILGNIYFEVEAKRPIPLYGIPSLV